MSDFCLLLIFFTPSLFRKDGSKTILSYRFLRPIIDNYMAMRFCSATKPYGFGTILLNFFVSIDRTTKYSLSSKKKKSSLNPKQREKNFLFGKKKRNCVTPFTKALAQETRIQSNPILFPGIFIAERKRAKSWSK